jgi:hypothetical protein
MGPDRAVEDARVDVSWPLVGRSAELAALTATIADARPGGMVLAGAVRVGKTRLAREAVDRTAAGRAVAWVAATQAAASIPFGAVSHLLPATERFGADRLETLRRAADLLAEQQWGGCWSSGWTTRTCWTTPRRRSSTCWCSVAWWWWSPPYGLVSRPPTRWSRCGRTAWRAAWICSRCHRRRPLSLPTAPWEGRSTG